MPDLDILVRLANLGTSGICIFGIFWTGRLIKVSSNSENEFYHLSLHKYMNMVIFVAIISLVSGVANSYIKQIEISKLEQQNIVLLQEKQSLKEEQVAFLTKAQSAKKTLELILQSKEAYQLRNPSDELKAHLDQLETYLDLQE